MYTFFVKLIAARSANNTLASSCSQNGEKADVIRERRRLTEFKETVVTAFLPMRCLWIAFVFIKIGTVYGNTFFIGHSEKVVLCACECVTLIFIQVYVINLCKSVKARTRKMTMAIHSCRMAEMSDLMNELRESSIYCASTVCPKFCSKSPCPIHPDVLSFR